MTTPAPRRSCIVGARNRVALEATTVLLDELLALVVGERTTLLEASATGVRNPIDSDVCEFRQ